MGTFDKLLINTLGIARKSTRSEMAINVGKRLADIKAANNGSLAKAEIESVFTECLPKNFRPKVLTTKEEMIPFFEKSGYSHELATRAANTPCAGMALPNGTHKRPFYVPTDNTDCSFVAHELLHTLDINNTLKCKAARHLAPVSLAFKKLIYGDRFMQRFAEMQEQSHYTQNTICSVFGLSTLPELQSVVKSINTKEDLLKYLNITKEKYEEQIKMVIREFVNPNVKGSQNIKRYELFKNTANMERPAYSVGGEVQRHAGVLKGRTHYSQKAVSFVYEDSKKILKQEKRLYIKNWLLGRLDKCPTKYQTEKDLYKLVTSKEEKSLIKELSNKMSNDGKNSLFWLLKKCPQSLLAVKTFLEKTSVNGKSIYSEYTAHLAKLNPKAMEDENFMKLALLKHNEGYPMFLDSISDISQGNPERIKKLLKLVQKYPDVDFQPFAGYCINHQNFDLLSKFATIKIGNEYVYDGLMYKLKDLSTEQLSELYKIAATVKDGTAAYDLIQSVGNSTFVKAEKSVLSAEQIGNILH